MRRAYRSLSGMCPADVLAGRTTLEYRFAGMFRYALRRTRTVDPLLTMEVSVRHARTRAITRDAVFLQNIEPERVRGIDDDLVLEQSRVLRDQLLVASSRSAKTTASAAAIASSTEAACASGPSSCASASARDSPFAARTTGSPHEVPGQRAADVAHTDDCRCQCDSFQRSRSALRPLLVATNLPANQVSRPRRIQVIRAQGLLPPGAASKTLPARRCVVGPD